MRGRRCREMERRDGRRINRFVMGSSEGIAKTEREGEKALKVFFFFFFFFKCYLQWLPGDRKRLWAKFSSAGCWSVMHSLKPDTLDLSSGLPPVWATFTWCLAERVWGHVCKKWKLTYSYNESAALHIFQVKAMMFLYFKKKKKKFLQLQSRVKELLSISKWRKVFS